MLQDGVAPRLPQVAVAVIPLGSGRHVVVIRFARSWQRPHMVTFENESRFYARNSAGKYQLNVDEIRSAVMSAPTAAARIRDFRNERVEAVRSGNVTVPMAGGPTLMLHLIPIDALDEGRLPLDIGRATDDPRLTAMTTTMTPKTRRTLDGLYTDDHWGAGGPDGSVLLFRTGIIEAVDTTVLAQEQYVGEDDIDGWEVERRVIDAVMRYTDVQKDVEASLPVVVLLTAHDVGARWLSTGEKWERIDARERAEKPRIDRTTLALAEVFLDAWDADMARVLRPIFDSLWQSAGVSQSPNYDADGNWSHKRAT